MSKVLKLNEKRLSLKESLKEAVQALKEDKCLVLKEAINLTILFIEITFMNFVRAEIALNEVKLFNNLFVEKQN